MFKSAGEIGPLPVGPCVALVLIGANATPGEIGPFLELLAPDNSGKGGGGVGETRTIGIGFGGRVVL